MSLFDFFRRKAKHTNPVPKPESPNKPVSSFGRPRVENMGTGANLDERPEKEREKDYKFEETVASINPVDWREKPQSEWRKFPIFNQNGSGSCVAQTLAKLLGIIYWLRNKTYVHFSATHIYQRRRNKPAGGMWATDAFDIASKGVTLEVLVPSQSMTDEQMDSAEVEEYKEDVGEIFKVPNYVSLPIRDIDTVASTIQTTGKGVMLWFFFKYSEWRDVPVIEDPNLPQRGNGVNRHSVTGVDFTMWKGEKAIIIEDSWGQQFGLAGQRVITESFFKARNFYAGYPIEFKFRGKEPKPEPQPEPQPQPQPQPRKPQCTLTKPLEFSPTFKVVEDVKQLQDILKYDGTFPKNIASTGYYGAITAKAVYDFQVKYRVASMEELNSLGGRRVGGKTLAKLQELYK